MVFVTSHCQQSSSVHSSIYSRMDGNGKFGVHVFCIFCHPHALYIGSSKIYITPCFQSQSLPLVLVFSFQLCHWHYCPFPWKHCSSHVVTSREIPSRLCTCAVRVRSRKISVCQCTVLLIKPGYIIDEGLTINVIQAPTDQCPCDLRLYSY